MFRFVRYSCSMFRSSIDGRASLRLNFYKIDGSLAKCTCLLREFRNSACPAACCCAPREESNKLGSWGASAKPPPARRPDYRDLSEQRRLG